jgi:hypothetical protein
MKQEEWEELGWNLTPDEDDDEDEEIEWRP